MTIDKIKVSVLLEYQYEIEFNSQKELEDFKQQVDSNEVTTSDLESLNAELFDFTGIVWD